MAIQPNTCEISKCCMGNQPKALSKISFPQELFALLSACVCHAPSQSANVVRRFGGDEVAHPRHTNESTHATAPPSKPSSVRLGWPSKNSPLWEPFTDTHTLQVPRKERCANGTIAPYTSLRAHASELAHIRCLAHTRRQLGATKICTVDGNPHVSVGLAQRAQSRFGHHRGREIEPIRKR